MEYNGDQATIMPDNTAAMLHFTDKFAEIEKNRKAQAKADALAERERMEKLGKTLGDAYKIDPTGEGDFDAKIREGIQEGYNKSMELYKRTGGDLTAVQNFANQTAGQLKSYKQGVENFKTELPKAIANIQGFDGIDKGALAELAKQEYFFKRDQDGNLVPKAPNELNNSEALNIPRLIAEHRQVLFPSPKKIFDKVVKDLPKLKVSGIDEYDEKTGDRKKAGYEGEVPEFAQVMVDETTGRPTVTMKAEPYKFPDGSVYIDPQTKEPVQVFPKDIYEKLMSDPQTALVVENDVDRVLERDKNNFTGQGEQMHGPNSEYANLVRQKVLFDKFAGYQNYDVKEKEDKSYERKKSMRSEQREAERLNLARKHYDLAVQTHRDAVKKGEAAPQDAPNIVDYWVNNNGVDAEYVNENGQTVTGKAIVNLDPNDDAAIQGEASVTTGITQTKVVKPANLKVNGKDVKGWIVRPDGNLQGAGTAVLDAGRINATVAKKIPAKKDKKLSDRIGGAAGKAARAIVGESKIAGIKKGSL